MSDGRGVGVFGDLGVLFTIGNVWSPPALQDFYTVAKVGNVFLCFGDEFCSVELAGKLS